jgi:hypothetical protein
LSGPKLIQTIRMLSEELVAAVGFLTFCRGVGLDALARCSRPAGLGVVNHGHRMGEILDLVGCGGQNWFQR